MDVFTVITIIYLLLFVGFTVCAYRQGKKDGKTESEIDNDILKAQTYAIAYRAGKQDMIKEMREAQLINEGEYDALAGEVK